MITLYGLKTCDTCRKARAWLEQHNIAYEYHDVRGDGLDPALLERWLQTTDWEKLLNRRSLTWRRIPDAEKDGIDGARAVALIHEHPTLLKRPVLEAGDVIEIGFSPARYAELVA
jgi:Spx/MgsR family transcriptional regulator